MANYAVTLDGLIVNRIVLDDPATWVRPENTVLHEEPEGGYHIGGRLENGVYTPPLMLPSPPL